MAGGKGLQPSAGQPLLPTPLSRLARRKEIESMMAIVVNGDACKPEDVERAFAAIDGVDAVVSTLGGTTADPTADSQVAPAGPPSSRCLWPHARIPAPCRRRATST